MPRQPVPMRWRKTTQTAASMIWWRPSSLKKPAAEQMRSPVWLAAKPSDDGLAIRLAQLCGRSGDFSKAETLLLRRLEADPKDSAINSALATLYRTIGRLGDARRLYDDLLAQHPDDVSALLGLADIASSQQKWPEAIGYIERARVAAPNDPATGLALVNLYGLRRDWKAAAELAAELA